jgi:hypothetical protein
MATNDHPTDVLAALALDAVGAGEERERVEGHISECPRCRQELDTMRDLAGALGHTVTLPPERLWTGISKHLYERREQHESQPPRLVALSSHPRRAHVTRRRATRAMATACAAAAVTIGLLAVALVTSNDKVADLQNALRDPAQATVVAALAAPGHRVVTLRSIRGAQLADFVLLPSGAGYLVHNHMPSVAPGRAYELWALVDGTPLPVGLINSATTAAAFTIASSPRPTELMVTMEPASGSLRPTTDPIGVASV